MWDYVWKRILLVIPVALGATLVVFTLIHIAPGDPVDLMLGEMASQEAVDEMRHELGLDRPLFIQYFTWLGKLFKGDLGRSIRVHQPVATILMQRVPVTLELTFSAIALAILIGVPAGVISAVKQYSLLDSCLMFVALFGISMPVFWQGMMLILVFGFYFGIAPISGYGSFSHLILPTIALGTIHAAVIARLTRSSMLECLRLDYVRTARSKGLRESGIVVRHVLRNALLPIVTIVGLRIPNIFGGAVITETVFGRVGMGRTIVQAIFNRDFPVLQGCVLLLALLVIISNLSVDLAYAFLDPRIHYD
jgi:ABC-type dipeptide/oligopeptide/nickel transport system permease component